MKRPGYETWVKHYEHLCNLAEQIAEFMWDSPIIQNPAFHVTGFDTQDITVHWCKHWRGGDVDAGDMYIPVDDVLREDAIEHAKQERAEREAEALRKKVETEARQTQAIREKELAEYLKLKAKFEPNG